MKTLNQYFFIALITLGLSACATDGTQPGDSLDVDSMSSADLLGETTVYFDFDSSSLDPQSRAIIKAHSAHLNANPNIKVSLEGHCDERGTREYNLALGERRAKAVSQLMRALGISSSRVSTVSYGEEKPVALGHNESDWRQNRRVEIKY